MALELLHDGEPALMGEKDSHYEAHLTLFFAKGGPGRSDTIALLDDARNDHLPIIGWPGFDCNGRTKKQNKANALRLIACWNACIGLPTELIETRSTHTVPRPWIADLVRQTEAAEKLFAEIREIALNGDLERGDRLQRIVARIPT